MGGLTRLELSRKSLSFNSNFEIFLLSQEPAQNYFFLRSVTELRFQFEALLKLKGVLVLKVDAFKRQNTQKFSERLPWNGGVSGH